MLLKKELEIKGLTHLDVVIPKTLHYQCKKTALEKGTTATQLVITGLTEYLETISQSKIKG